MSTLVLFHNFGCAFCRKVSAMWESNVEFWTRYGEVRSESIIRQHWQFLDSKTRAAILESRPDLTKLCK